MNPALIVGLGNPGKKYQRNRHNLAFRVLDKLAHALSTEFRKREKFFSEIGETILGDKKIILAKPQTFMNKSEKAVAALKGFYKLTNADILIIQDEIDLPFGTIRTSKNAGSAGHKGIESIIAAIGKNFTRLRVGIDARKVRQAIATDDYVMQNFSPEEEKKLEKVIIPQGIEKLKDWLKKQAPR